MNYTDYLFLPLSVVVMGIYFILPVKARWCWLLFINLLFVASWGLDLLPILLAMTLIAWLGGRLVFRQVVKKENRKRGKRVLILFIFLLFLPLVYIKLQQYLIGWKLLAPVVMKVTSVHRSLVNWRSTIPFIRSDWISPERYTGLRPVLKDIIHEIPKKHPYVFFGWNLRRFLRKFAAGLPTYAILAPLGISYYTFSLIGYMADVFWKKEKAETNYFKLLLFTSYYPKILEGPISKHRTVAPQLVEGHRFDYQRVCFGLQRAVWGFFKKWVIADRLAIIVTYVFKDLEGFCGSQILVAAIFGAFQLYCDFSGCMDIGLGISECFGITLEENFRRPFFSRSAAEFWRRWHISLGVWFKDYVYMPLSVSPKLMKIARGFKKRLGRRAGKNFMTIIPLSIVWLLTGLWHGTGINYIVWGCYWGIIIILTTVFEPEIRKLTKWLKIPMDSKGYVLFQQIRTFLLFVFSRLITLPDSLEGTGVAIRKIFTEFQFWKLFNGSLLTEGVDEKRLFIAILALMLLWVVSRQEEKGQGYREWVADRPIVLRWIIYYAVIFAVLIFGAYGSTYNASAFVYMQY